MPVADSCFADRHAPQWVSLYWLVVTLLLAASLFSGWVSVWSGPFRDMWEALPFVEKAFDGHAVLADYWEQYGFSHRPLVSRWLWVADCRWFACSNHLLIGVSLACQLAIAVAVWRMLCRDADLSRAIRLAVLPGVLLCLGNVTQLFNILHTFDVQWFLVAASVTWSVECLLAGRERSSSGCLILAWLLVLVGSLNNFSALVMWPVHCLFLLRLGYRPVQFVVYVVATLLYFLLYFHGLPASGSLSLASQPGIGVWVWLVSVLYVFPVWYLSNPMSFHLSAEGPWHAAWPVTWLAPGLLTLLLLWCGWWAMRALLRRHSLSPVAWAGVLLVIYGYGVAVVTALGRAYFWDNVYALRYQNIVLLFWIGVLLLLVGTARSRWTGALVGAVLLMVVVGVHQAWQHQNMIKMGNRTRDAHLALRVGLAGELSAIQATVSRSHLGAGNAYNLNHEADFLRRIGGGPYADPAWQVPPLAALQAQPNCTTAASAVDVHGQAAAYARLGMEFTNPVHYDLIAWFDSASAGPGLLLPVQADSFVARAREFVMGVTTYAGFAAALPVQAPQQLYARTDQDWCHLSVQGHTASP